MISDCYISECAECGCYLIGPYPIVLDPVCDDCYLRVKNDRGIISLPDYEMTEGQAISYGMDFIKMMTDG